MTEKESERNLSLVIVGVLVYLAMPVVLGLGLFISLSFGLFPPESDSIAIPFAGFLLLWFGGLLIAGLIATGLIVSKFYAAAKDVN